MTQDNLFQLTKDVNEKLNQDSNLWDASPDPVSPIAVLYSIRRYLDIFHPGQDMPVVDRTKLLTITKL